MNNKLVFGGAIVAVCAVIGYFATNLATQADDASAGTSETAGASAQGGSAKPAALLADVDPKEPFPGTTTESGGFTGDVTEGGAESPITVIEYASLTCPHCASFHKTIYNKIKPDYIDNEKIRFVYRDFPLDNFALAASVIARCGGESKYVGFVDLFMEKQDQWRNADNVLDELKRLARLGGLGSEQIDNCMKDQALGQSVVDRARLGQDKFEVRSTPTLLINGEKFDGPMNLDGLTARLDELLAE